MISKKIMCLLLALLTVSLTACTAGDTPETETAGETIPAETEIEEETEPPRIYPGEEMDFGGVIMTDDLTMQAITDLYGAGEAAVMAVLAGNDLLCCTVFEEQYEAVLAAVLEGRIPFDTVKNAVRNVLEWKQQIGLI
jgi:aspartate oxidase